MSISVSRSCGTIALKGDLINALAQKWISRMTDIPATALARQQQRDENNGFHLTIITPAEFSHVAAEMVKDISSESEIQLFDVGMGHIINKDGEESWFVSIYCPWAESLRKSLELGNFDFHITLGFHRCDIHVPKNYNKIYKWNDNLFDVLENILTVTDTFKVESTSHLLKASCIVSKVLDILYEDNQSTTSISLSKENLHLFRRIIKWCLLYEQTALISSISSFLIMKGCLYGIRLLLQSFSSNLQSSSLVTTSLKFNAYEYFRELVPLKIEFRGQSVEHEREIFIRLNSYVDISQKHAKVFNLSRNLQLNNHLFMDLFPLPRNFSTIRLSPKVPGSTIRNYNWNPFLLVASAIPTNVQQLIALSGLGVTNILTIHEKPFPKEILPDASHIIFQTHHYAIEDRTTPSLKQLQEICLLIHKYVTSNNGILIHCQGGVGRTNTAIIAYLMWTENLSAADATALVASQRKLILSESQKARLLQWWVKVNSGEVPPPTFVSGKTELEVLSQSKGISSSDSVASATSIEPSAPLPAPPHPPPAVLQQPQQRSYRPITITLSLPPLILLCGYQASGKSTFANALVAAYPRYFVRVNRDEMRGKGQCSEFFQRELKRITSSRGGCRRGGNEASAGAVVLDCCNLTVAKRKEWLMDAGTGMRVWCLFFDIPIEECEYRIRRRRNHPTIPSGEAGVTILRSVAKQLQVPEASEGFEKVIVLTTVEQVEQLLHDWSIPLPDIPAESMTCDMDGGDVSQSEPLLKFPRTAHAWNLGAATRDDKIASHSDLAQIVGSGREVIVEEKIDGANVGISISRDGLLVVQNRSHYITHEYHPQFFPLKKWLAKHTAELWDILEPGRHILFGEWMYATHSVKYNRLPDWFIAYDLYDRQSKTFLSRSRIESALSNTSIPIVPVVYQGAIENIDQLKALVNGPSFFGDMRREGIVIRLCSEQQSDSNVDEAVMMETLAIRMKLVRTDFMPGNERWNRTSKLEVNLLATEVDH